MIGQVHMHIVYMIELEFTNKFIIMKIEKKCHFRGGICWLKEVWEAFKMLLYSFKKWRIKYHTSNKCQLKTMQNLSKSKYFILNDLLPKLWQ